MSYHYSPSAFNTGLISGFHCASHTIAHISQQHITAVFTSTTLSLSHINKQSLVFWTRPFLRSLIYYLDWLSPKHFVKLSSRVTVDLDTLRVMIKFMICTSVSVLRFRNDNSQLHMVTCQLKTTVSGAWYRQCTRRSTDGQSFKAGHTRWKTIQSDLQRSIRLASIKNRQAKFRAHNLSSQTLRSSMPSNLSENQNSPIPISFDYKFQKSLL